MSKSDDYFASQCGIARGIIGKIMTCYVLITIGKMGTVIKKISTYITDEFNISAQFHLCIYYKVLQK